jgi:Arc/MetJ-type ribon-helix-helix transcriptional regulator
MVRKSIRVIPKKRGRPATGKDPLVAVRLPPEMIREIDAWAKHNTGGSRSEAIRRFIEKALAGTIAPRQPRKGAARKATEMAALEIDRVLGDQSASGEERASRKRRLLSGPKEFRDMRRK